LPVWPNRNRFPNPITFSMPLMDWHMFMESSTTSTVILWISIMRTVFSRGRWFERGDRHERGKA